MKTPVIIAYDGKYFELEFGAEVENPNGNFIIASNGIFIFNENPGYTIIKEAKKLPGKFDEVKIETSFAFPTISYEIYRKALAFCRSIFKQHKSEANVLLVLSRDRSIEKQEYRIIIPKQRVTGASVKYEVNNSMLKKGEYLAGSIHSHPDFGASQSSTDHADEIQFDGIHITLGHIMKQVPEIHQRLVLNNETYSKMKVDLINIIPPADSYRVPKKWTDQVEKRKPQITKVYSSDVGYGSFPDNDDMFHVGCGIHPSLDYNRHSSKHGNKTVSELWKTIEPHEPRNQRNSKKLKPIVPRDFSVSKIFKISRFGAN